MKRTFTLLLALALIFMLAACGKSGDSSNSNDGTGRTLPGSTAAAAPEASIPDLDSVIGGTGKPSDYNGEARQAMIDAARAEGGDLEFKADGSMVYTDPDGSVTIQNADGSWTYQDEGGGTVNAQIGGDWPENEFTKLIPKPDFALSVGASDEESFSVMFSSVTADELKDYVEKVKAAGFDIDAETEDMEAMGMVVYGYTAQNKDGYAINVFSASGISGLSITKP